MSSSCLSSPMTSALVCPPYRLFLHHISASHTLPFSRFPIISRPVTTVVLHNVGKSSVLKKATSSQQKPLHRSTAPTPQRLTISITKEQHRRNPPSRVLQREAILLHLILLHIAPAEMMHAALRIHLGCVDTLTRRVSQLLAFEDMEVVVCGVAA